MTTTQNAVFELINRAEQFGDQKIDMVIVGDKPWFRAKNVAAILEYKMPKSAIRDNVDNDDKKTLSDLVSGGAPTAPLTNNQKTSLYINESGLYSLILGSKLPSAKVFKKWVTAELLPKIRKIGQEQYLEQLREENARLAQERDALEIENKENQLLLDEKEALIEEKETLLEEQDSQINRLHNTQKELLSYKKRVTRNETVYIVSTNHYSTQGVFKVGRTKKEMKFRSTSHNTTHVAGDKVKVLAKYKVYDCVLVERNIHTKLAGLLLEGEQEFFKCPFDLLNSIVNLIVNNDDQENEIVNRIIDTVYMLKTKAFSAADWTAGIPEDAFAEALTLTDGTTELARFNVTGTTDDQKKAFIRECIEAYNRTIVQPNQLIVWTEFQAFMRQYLEMVKSHYKTGEWKKLVKEEVEQLPEVAAKFQWVKGRPN